MAAYRCVVLLVLAACSHAEPGASPDSVKPSVADQPSASAVSSDSLPPGYGRPHPGSWNPTSEYADSLFTIRYPSSATAEKRPPRDRAQEVVVSELPECRWPCYVTVHMQRDTSTTSLETAIREETTADTSDSPEAAEAAYEAATIRDSLPLGTARAVHLETYCGDCTSGELVTAHGPWLAHIEYNLDDRDGNNQLLLARLVEIARTFRWRDQGPEPQAANDR